MVREEPEVTAPDEATAETRHSSDPATLPIASPYSTGGGGTALEHRYGAVLLSHLLAEDAVPMLGDDVALREVHFQGASAGSPVDDFVLTGDAPDGSRRRLSLAVRRAPSFVASHEPTVKLLGDFLKVVTAEWDEVFSGQWRLGLQVADRACSIDEIQDLCQIARAVGDAATFVTEVAIPGRTTASVRDRLPHITATISKASGGIGSTEITTNELTWRLLSHLLIMRVHLEGADESSRSEAVARLRDITRGGDLPAADGLFGRLVELAQGYGPTASRVTIALLRRDLAGFPLARVRSARAQWEILDRWGQRAQDRTHFNLQQATTSLELPRSALMGQLSASMGGARTNVALLVQGAPDVGKSSLVLREARRIRDDGADVVTLSLRDLPIRIAEFEAQLGCDLDAVFASSATEIGRLLVVDGAEAVLEGHDLALQDLATSALRQGFTVVAISRSDGAKAVVESLRNACVTAGLSEPQTFEIPPLTDAEMEEVGRAFPSVSHLLTDPRTVRLLARPGLMNLLLRTGTSDDVRGPLSEADVFNATWMAVVRRGERVGAGQATPDAREQALLALARRALGLVGPGTDPDPAALPSLRSDGLLLPVRVAWAGAPEFGSDLLRDFSLARLLLVEGWAPLDVAAAPRWSIRATRLACQGRLLRAGPDRDRQRQRLASEFAQLSDRHGTRWAEIPAEALLTLGNARDALEEAWPSLTGSGHDDLTTLLRLAEQRYTESGFGDTVVLAPLVELAFCGAVDLGQHDRHDRTETGPVIRRLVLAWLNGLTKVNAGSTELRRRIRDVILEHHPEMYDDFAVSALASLGPDLDDRVEAFLLGMASDGGGHLGAVVEEIGPILAMSSTKPDLLVRLADAYYIEAPPKQPHGSPFDDWYHFREGIRSHGRGRGIGAPMAAWYYGPFFRLLNVTPVQAVGLVNRMLDRAAEVDVSDRDRPPDTTDPSSLPAIELGFRSIPTRRCVGSPRTWMWYRGSSTGPYPCVSALLAVERFADNLIANVGMPIPNVVEFLLRDCHNLAMPGLVAGLLIRHRAFELLDDWLVHPELWHLEFARLASEGVIHVQGRDDETVVGREFRRYTFRETAAEMTVTALVKHDQDRLDALGRIADALVASARQLLGDADDVDASLAMVEGWAAALRPENIDAKATEDGHLVIEFAAPEPVASRLEPGQAQIERNGEAVRLLNRYAREETRIRSAEHIREDLATGRRLAETAEPGGFFLEGPEPVAAVAAAAIVAAARGLANIPLADKEWATQILVDAALAPRVDQFSIPESFYAQGADRSAAAALPSAGLTDAVTAAGVERYKAALEACGRSLFDEVRAALVVGARPVWGAPCRSLGEVCLHELVWRAIEGGVADSRLGDWNEEGLRESEPLAGPYEETLPMVSTDHLYLNRLTHPLIAAWDASRSSACVAAAAGQLLPVLVETHRRVANLWAKEGYGHFGDRDRRRVAAVLVSAAAAGDPGYLRAHLSAFAANGAALQELLSDMSFVFTYDAELRKTLPAVWPGVMDEVLSAWESGRLPAGRDHWRDYSIRHLLPTPKIDTGDTNIDATLDAARASWIEPDDLDAVVERWLRFAEREPMAVDAVVEFSKCASVAWQMSRGLELVERTIAGGYDEVASRMWHLAEWLKEIRYMGLQEDAMARWRRVVDGLAAAGDSRAARLQAAEE
jgi:hypothetical protein